MLRIIKKITGVMAFVPLFAFPGLQNESSNFPTQTSIIIIQEKNTEEKKDNRAELLDQYFKDRSMPLEGYGRKFIEVADKYNLDWRLLPAIAIRESSGGKKACYNNPFGWGSCRIKFKDFNEAIEKVGWNLAGENPRTAYYYKDKSNYDKLYYYNGTVIPSYPNEVLAIMKRFEKQ